MPSVNAFSDSWMALRLVPTSGLALGSQIQGSSNGYRLGLVVLRLTLMSRHRYVSMDMVVARLPRNCGEAGIASHNPK